MLTGEFADRTVGSIARDHSAALRVFDRYGVDYCCHGQETLKQSCTRAACDVAEVARALASALSAAPAGKPVERSWSDATMAALCDHIEAVHHVLARDVFARCDQLLPRVVAAHGEREPHWHGVAGEVQNLRDEMLDHMLREERVLFPWLRRLESPEAVTIGPLWSVKRPIDCMVHDHDAVGAGLQRLRQLTNGFTPPPDACGSVTALLQALSELDRDTRIHIHKENNILFPAGIHAESVRASRPQPQATT